MKKFVVLFLAITMITSLQSCKKEKEETKSEPTAKELLTDDVWNHKKREHYDTDGNLEIIEDLDNKMEFTPSGSYYYFEETGDLVEYGVWEFLNNESQLKLTIHDHTNSLTVDIVELTENKLIISVTDSNGKIALVFER